MWSAHYKVTNCNKLNQFESFYTRLSFILIQVSACQTIWLLSLEVNGQIKPAAEYDVGRNPSVNRKDHYYCVQRLITHEKIIVFISLLCRG